MKFDVFLSSKKSFLCAYISLLFCYVPEAAKSEESIETTVSETVKPPSTSKKCGETALQQCGANSVWVDEFEIPWSKFPKKKLMTCLQNELLPNPSARREMVRILVDEISKISQKPGKKALATIAQKIVKKYKKSFKDEIEGTLVGYGYDSLLNQLQTRFDNINRNSNSNSLKRKSSLVSENEVVEVGATLKISIRERYGCINYMPSDYPDGESESTQENKKVLLKQKYKQRLNGEVEDLMRETYFSQRKDIVEKNGHYSLKK